MKKILVIALVLALVVAIAAPLAVSATPAITAGGSSEISGNVGAVISLTAPDPINFGSMTPRTLPYTGSNTNGSVSCNSANGCNVTVASDQAEGKMYVGSLTLQNPLLVTTGTKVSGIAVTTSPADCITPTEPGITEIDLSVSQTIVYADTAASSYSLTLTYTGTLTP